MRSSGSSNYTPGPWKRLWEEGKFICQSGSGAHIATMADGWPPEDIEANANLIAAAPDLLEALRALLGVYRLKRPQIFGSDQWEETARAAIAKAEKGGASEDVESPV
ncbi:MAG: hypothetical protein Q8R28_11415 [Dehalococcoidia bacterium]|nr:hypothetical protein [Dehalococcoidia bacterium]